MTDESIKALALYASNPKARSLTDKGHALLNRHTMTLLAKGLITYGGRSYVVTAEGKRILAERDAQ